MDPVVETSSGRGFATGLGPIVLSSFLFGLMAVGVRLAARSMAATEIAFFRFAGSLVVLLVATCGRGLIARPGTLRPLLVRGLIGSIAIVLYFIGIWGAGAGLATLVQNTYPLFAALFAATVLGEPFSRRLGFALALDVGGLAIVVGPDFRGAPQVAFGVLAAASAAVLSGGAVVAARHLRRTESATIITTYFMAVGACLTAPSLLDGIPPLSAPLVAALALVVVSSVGGQWLLHHGLGYTSAATASLVAGTSVVTAATIESIGLGQPLAGHVFLGACFILTAIGLAAGAVRTPRHRSHAGGMRSRRGSRQRTGRRPGAAARARMPDDRLRG